MGLKNIIYLGAFSLFVVIVWIIMGIYHTRITSTVSTSTAKKAAPIPSSFDTDTINQLQQRRAFQVNLSDQIALPTIAPSQNTPSTSSAETNQTQSTEQSQEESIEESAEQI